MDTVLKGKLDKAFDAGELERLPDSTLAEVDADPEARGYLARLRAIAGALHEPRPVAAPADFCAQVLKRLPGAPGRRPKKVGWLRDLLLPVYFIAMILVFVFFRDALGFSAMLSSVTDALAAEGDSSMEILFAVITSAGILFSLWLIVTSFFGIRVRKSSRS